MNLWLSSVALADTWAPFEDGFVSPPRQDAPLDGQIVYAANYAPRATATSSTGTSVELESIYLTGVGAPPRIAFLPPSSGWSSGETWDLSVLDYEGVEADSFTFTAGTSPAAPPAEVTVGEIEITDWSDDQTYAWGCCYPVRTVTVEVSVPEADAWDRVEVVGQFDLGRPSQITTQEIHTHLDLALGSGDHVLSFEQWRDERGPQPPCFEVVAVSAAGERGEAQAFCPEEEEEDEPLQQRAGACQSASHPSSLWALLGVLLSGRIRRPRAP